MGIITKYLIRAHTGPFLFSFSALTGLLFLNAVAQRMDSLIGKGLSWNVIGEFLLLSLPHTIALTLPMAILVSVLYTFSELTATNEITAMSAGGISPARMLIPLLGLGVVLAGVMLFFNDRLLPAANHRLKDLIIDISQKSPTLELRERVINQIESEGRGGNIYLKAATIDPVTNQMTEVVIYDLSDPNAHRTTYAERGQMAFNRRRTDLYLTLFDGEVLEAGSDRTGKFHQSEFEVQIVPLRGIGDELIRRQGGSIRSDREMSIAMLQDEIDERVQEIERVQQNALERSRGVLRDLLGRTLEDEDGVEETTARGASLTSLRGRRTFSDGTTRTVALNSRQDHAQVEALRSSVNQYKVEIHKKYAIAFACIVFVLLGAPLAIRFPRGGIGMVIAVSVGIFAVYWAGLIGGENLADEGVVPPFWAMWAPDLTFLAIGMALVMRMGRGGGANRGGGLDEIFFLMGRRLSGFSRIFRRAT
jgi:lipopolysaccharide export system permease protein